MKLFNFLSINLILNKMFLSLAQKSVHSPTPHILYTPAFTFILSGSKSPILRYKY